MTTSRQRLVTTERFPSSRHLVIGGFRAGRRRIPMYGLLDLDVTWAMGSEKITRTYL